MTVLFVGPNDSYLADKARHYDSSATLITLTNYYNLENVPVGYISLSDFNNVEIFYNLLCSAKKIIFCPPKHWPKSIFDFKPFSEEWLTIYYINLAANVNNIPVDNNIELTQAILSTKPVRKSNNRQLWVLGCSTTNGSGVLDHEKYSTLISKDLNLIHTLIAENGSSIQWAGNQLLSSDLHKNDIVVWGLTSISRFPWFHPPKLYHVGSNTTFINAHQDIINDLPMDYLLSTHHMLYQAIITIENVINFCNKIGVNLVMLGIHCDLELSTYLSKYKNFIPVHGTNGLDWDSSFLDFGNDNAHPGPDTHKMYATIAKKYIVEHFNI